jgi:hypothetical protein
MHYVCCGFMYVYVQKVYIRRAIRLCADCAWAYPFFVVWYLIIQFQGRKIYRVNGIKIKIELQILFQSIE